MLAAPVMLATALAPWAGAAMAVPLGGYPMVFLVPAGPAAVAALQALAAGTAAVVVGRDAAGAARRGAAPAAAESEV